jgi:hypothetical protein
MRDAFEGLRDGRLSPGFAEDEFLLGYDTVSDISTAFFLGRPRGKPRTADDDRVL